MKKYRQWLAESQNHMTESPDGEYVLYADHLEIVRKLEKKIKDLKKEMQRREDYIEGCLV